MIIWDSWQTTLPAMAIGMIGIFLVVGMISAAICLLNVLTGKKRPH